MIFRIKMSYCKKIFTFSLLFFLFCTVISLEFLTRISSFFYQTLVSNFFNSITSIDTTFNGNEIADAISSLYNEIILLCLVIVVLVLGILTFIERNHSSYYGFLESLTFSTFGSSFSKKLKFNFSSVRFTSKAEGYLDLAFLLFPSSIIFYIIVPTLGFLYNKDINVDSTLSSFSVDIVGHQWYWSYSYNISLLDGNNLFFMNPITGDYFMDFITESYIEFDSILDMDSKYLRLLNVDHCFVLPVHTNIRLSLTSVDVIHS